MTWVPEVESRLASLESGQDLPWFRWQRAALRSIVNKRDAS